MFRTSLIAAAIALAATPMMADDVTDTLSSAMHSCPRRWTAGSARSLRPT